MTEEVWSWWQDGSIHLAPWPTPDEFESLAGGATADTAAADRAAYDWAADVLFEVRKQRSEAKQPLKVPITKVRITADQAAVALMPLVQVDLRSALRVRAFEVTVGDPRSIVVDGYEAT